VGFFLGLRRFLFRAFFFGGFVFFALVLGGFLFALLFFGRLCCGSRARLFFFFRFRGARRLGGRDHVAEVLRERRRDRALQSVDVLRLQLDGVDDRTRFGVAHGEREVGSLDLAEQDVLHAQHAR